MKLEDREKLNQVIGVLLAIETMTDEDGISTAAREAGFLLKEILDSDRLFMSKEEGK